MSFCDETIKTGLIFKVAWKLFTPMEGRIHVKATTLRASTLITIVCFSCMANVGCAGFSGSDGSKERTTGFPSSSSISGQISPVASAIGTIVTLKGVRGTVTTFTDRFGRYSFGDLANGSYSVSASRGGVNLTPAAQFVRVEDSNAAEIDFTAAQVAGSIWGTITPAPNGGGVTVTLSGPTRATTATDSVGNFNFNDLPSGTYTVTPSKSGFTFSPPSRTMTLASADFMGVSFSVSKVSSSSSPPPSTFGISGSISPAANGAGAIVTLGGTATASTTADSFGNFSFSGLPSGTYTLTPSKSGYTFGPSMQSTTVAAASVAAVNFAASKVTAPPPPTFSISGSITPAANGPGTTVTLSGAGSATATADNFGNFSFGGLSNGIYTLTPSKNGYTFGPSAQVTSVASASVSGVIFTASKVIAPPPPTFSISGSISPAANGAGATVTLGGAASASTTADSMGNFSFSGLASGTYTLTPTKNGYTFGPSTQSTTVAAANVAGVNFAAAKVSAPPPATFSISGSITPTTNGTGVTITLSGAASATTSTDSSGNYSFSGLPAGTYTLTPSKNGFAFNPPSQVATVSDASASGVSFATSQQSTSGGGVTISPGDDIPSIVAASPAGTTFVINPGTYRLTRPIIPKTGDSFVGQAACAPPASSCPAIISGSTVIGQLATFDGTNYRATGQTQQNQQGTGNICDGGWSGCVYPEDLFFDGVPYQHLNSATLPAIGPGQWWFDYANHTIYFHDSPSGHTVETSVVNNAFGGSANNVTIQYLTVEEFASMYPVGAIGVSQGNNALTQSTNWTIENSEITLNHGYGVRVNYGTQILNNYIHDNGQLGIGGGIGTHSNPSTQSVDSAVLIQGNTINHNDYAHFSAGWGSGGFKVGSTSGIVLRGNTIQHNEGAGIHFDMNSQSEWVDGNTITDNTDADGLEMEIGYGLSTFRNNVVLRNGTQVNNSNYTYQIAVRSSSGVNAYCNIMEVSSGPGINGWGVDATNRGYSSYPPYQYLVSTGNSFHHNTVLWDAGANGKVGFHQNDVNQPNFFANNSAPDFNSYHLPSLGAADFQYNSGGAQNSGSQVFPIYQAAGADVHGSADSNYSSGYPTVAITSPGDQSSVSSGAAVVASASDQSGISKVEFYVDWVLQATSTSSPYTFTWTNGASGLHTVAAMAYSNAGVSACSAVTLNQQ